MAGYLLWTGTSSNNLLPPVVEVMRHSLLLTLVALFSTASLLHPAPAAAQSGDRYGAPLSRPVATSPPATNSDGFSTQLPFGEARDLGRSLNTETATTTRPAELTAPAYPPASNSPATRPYGNTRATRSATNPPTRSALGDRAASTPPRATGSSYAEQMMTKMLTAPTGSRLSGSRLSGSRIGLAEVVQSAQNRAEQSRRVNAYWDLCSAVADYYLSLYEQAELERLAATTPQLSTPLRSAIAKLRTRRDTALTAARATQHRLAAMMGNNRNSSLPLPGDLPHCGTYRTRFNETFADGGPTEANELNQLLPLRYTELIGAAQAVREAEEWFVLVVTRTNDAKAAEAVVRALELLALNRRAFVQISRDYNRRITRYTELARPGKVRSERLVAMLIKTSNYTANRRSSPATLPGRSTQTGPPETFRGNWQTPSGVVPAGYSATEAFVEKVSPGESSVLRRKPAGS